MCCATTEPAAIALRRKLCYSAATTPASGIYAANLRAGDISWQSHHQGQQGKDWSNTH